MSIFSRAAALVLVGALSLSPAAALTPAVSAPSPASQGADLTSAYQNFADAAQPLGLTARQRILLWNRGGTDVLTHSGLDWLLLPHAHADRTERYAAFAAAHPFLTKDLAVTAVNAGLDQPFYENVAPVADPESRSVLVNKHHALAADYVPQLEALGSAYGRGSLQPEAARQFRAMADAARAEGISLRSVSAYRSYATQRYTYNSYLDQYSQLTVDTFSARPGHSEHQTGLALDINVARTSAHFEDTPAYAWLVKHCARFGFILRYPPDKTHITGYRFEPWHYRYVGAEAAARCMAQGLTWEEYTAQLPAEGPALFLNGAPLTDCAALLLDGVTYLPAADLARVAGRTVAQTGTTLTVDETLSLSPGLYALREGVSVRLSSPALWLEGALYLPAEELSHLLGLNLQLN